MSQDLQNYPVMNPTFTFVEVETTSAEAVLVIEPLEQGYGHTIGNALRRVLLSSLPGAAVTKVRIEGVDHQFSTLEGVREDIVELILQIKQIRVKSTTNEPGTMTLAITGAAEVTAQDIEVSAGYSIVNPELVLAHVARGKSLQVEMTVESGMGYSMAQDREASGVIGEIAIDALFSPIIKVSYDVEATRVGRRTDFDKVILKIQTDGTIMPGEAVRRAAQILSRQFQQIVDPVVQVAEEATSSLSPEEAETLRLTVEELDLPTRIANALRKGGFKTVADLVGAPKQTVAKVKNLGEKSVDVINEALQKKGVQLGE